MTFEIRQVVWLNEIVDKLRWKHGVEEFEVIEVLENSPRIRRKEDGIEPGEDVYGAYGRTVDNRPLAVFFVYTLDRRAIIVSARDMTPKELKRYGQ
jgi:uncharacterized DUF497 family protein